MEIPIGSMPLDQCLFPMGIQEPWILTGLTWRRMLNEACKDHGTSPQPTTNIMG